VAGNIAKSLNAAQGAADSLPMLPIRHNWTDLLKKRAPALLTPFVSNLAEPR
jgi:hypothetical protein